MNEVVEGTILLESVVAGKPKPLDADPMSREAIAHTERIGLTTGCKLPGVASVRVTWEGLIDVAIADDDMVWVSE